MLKGRTARKQKNEDTCHDEVTLVSQTGSGVLFKHMHVLIKILLLGTRVPITYRKKKPHVISGNQYFVPPLV